MAEKIINGFSVVAYATQPEGRVPARAFLETRRLPAKPAKATKDAPSEPQVEAEPAEADEPESLAFEIFVTRRFRSTVEAMSAARNALDRVKAVDAEGVPDHLPD
ncbi:hypothetical protein [Achromobacter sp. 79A6]|jgi:hypothetical protein|uniref:hypothetical protein n=1 Tax=unclassified Achromobacter TaxID=2626865 RepID=UPI0021F1465F